MRSEKQHVGSLKPCIGRTARVQNV